MTADYDDTTLSDPYSDAPIGAGQEGESDLARLTAIVAIETGRTIDLAIPDVPGRSDVHLRLQVGTLTGARINGWRKQATKGRRNDVDGFLFNALVVANCCEAILVGDKVMHDPDGDPYNFRSTDFIDSIKAKSAADAAVRFVGSDGIIASLAGEVLSEAGFGAELDADPTVGG